VCAWLALRGRAKRVLLSARFLRPGWVLAFTIAACGVSCSLNPGPDLPLAGGDDDSASGALGGSLGNGGTSYAGKQGGAGRVGTGGSSGGTGGGAVTGGSGGTLSPEGGAGGQAGDAGGAGDSASGGQSGGAGQ